MRADQRLMIAVGAIGLGALGLLVFGKPRAEEEAAPPPPSPSPIPIPPLPIPIPVVPPPVPPPAPVIRPTAVRYLSSPASLESGRHYRAIVQISPIEASIPFVDKRKAVADKFAQIGFGDVRVYESLSELPFNWPSETIAGLVDDNRTFFAEGTWNSLSVTINLPSQIVKAWIDDSQTAAV